MKIERKVIKVRDLFEKYSDDGEGGVYGYNNRLTIRPSYQREFIYKDKQRDAVIDSVKKGFPLNVMYWSKVGDDEYEVLDGQQRTISICQYINKDYSINHRFWHNLTDDEKDVILDYDLDIYICEGTEQEKLEWFRTINIAGAVLTEQELLNATYSGTWLSDAKVYFSKANCVAGLLADGYIKGNPIRQDYLAKVLNWIADSKGLDKPADYMADKQHDKDANELWQYFQKVINWAKTLFPEPKKGITDSQDWGILYNKYQGNSYNTNDLKEDMEKLLYDEDVQKQSGIIPYLLSDRMDTDEKLLNIRAFPLAMKRRVYEKQGHKCPRCVESGVDKEYEFQDMEGDHKVPWSKGGRTVEENLEMLCREHNRAKSNK